MRKNGKGGSAVLVYIDGEFVPKEEAKISVWDHGFLYGDGVFEGIRVYNGRVFRLDHHLRRLYNSAKSIALQIPLTYQEMRKTLLEAVRKNNMRDCYIRLVISRGTGDLGLDPRKCKKPTLVIIVDKIQLYPEKLYKEGLKIVIAATRRNLPEALNPKIKSLNYLNNILAKVEAIQAECEEAIMINNQGYVVECTADNIFLVQDGTLLTPPPHVGILEGITRGVIIELAEKMKIPCREELFGSHDVFIADECFLTGTGAEVVPVVSVNGRAIGDGKPGPVTLRLLQAFKEYTQREGVPVFEPEIPFPRPEQKTLTI